MEDKPSYKTTAFIIVAVNVLINALAAIQQYIPAQTAAIISACLTAVFAICNAWLKTRNPPPLPSPTRGEGDKGGEGDKPAEGLSDIEIARKFKGG